MKIGIFSDLHVHEKSLYKLGEQHLKRVYDIFRKNRCECVFFLGDLFNTKYRVAASVLSAVTDFFKNEPLKTIFIPGNHDLASNGCLIDFLKLSDTHIVIEEPSILEIDELEFLFHPYTRDVKNMLLEDADVLLMHQYIHGTYKINNIPITFSENISDSIDPNKLSKYKMVLSGHLHLPLDIGNIHFIGTPFTNSFGETESNMGFVILDTKTMKIKRYKLNEVKTHRSFRVFDEKDIDSVKFNDNDFVIIMTTKEIQEKLPKSPNVQFIIVKNEVAEHATEVEYINMFNYILNVFEETYDKNYKKRAIKMLKEIMELEIE